MPAKTASGRLQNLYNHEKFSDITFELHYENRLFKVKGHKAIFAEASEVFEAMLFGPLADENMKVYKIFDIDPEAFLSLKQYIYADAINFSSVYHAKCMYKLGDHYNFSDLADVAIGYLSDVLCADNVLEIYEFCKLYDKDERVRNVEVLCDDMISIKTEDVLNSADFLKVDLEFLKKIVERNELNVSEINLFKAVEKWAEINTQACDWNENGNDSVLLAEVINKIRFLVMSVDEFPDGPGKSSLMTLEERHSLMMNLVKPGCIPLPDRFSTEKTSRIKCKLVWKLSNCNESGYAAVKLKIWNVSLLPSTKEKSSPFINCGASIYCIYITKENDRIKVYAKRLREGVVKALNVNDYYHYDYNYHCPRFDWRFYRNGISVIRGGGSFTFDYNCDENLLFECKNEYTNRDCLELVVNIDS